MIFDKWIKNWKTLLAENFFLKIVTLLFGVGLILNATIFKKNQIVIISPPEVREEYWVGKNETSEDYIEQMGVFFSVLAGNLSPKSAAYNINALLNYVSPDIYGEVKNSLMGEAMSVIDNNVTQSFSPNDVKVEDRTVTVKGETIRRIGAAKPTKEKVMYNMTFKTVNYKVYLTEFYVDYPDKIRRALINKMKGITDKDDMQKRFESIERDEK